MVGAVLIADDRDACDLAVGRVVPVVVGLAATNIGVIGQTVGEIVRNYSRPDIDPAAATLRPILLLGMIAVAAGLFFAMGGGILRQQHVAAWFRLADSMRSEFLLGRPASGPKPADLAVPTSRAT